MTIRRLIASAMLICALVLPAAAAAAKGQRHSQLTNIVTITMLDSHGGPLRHRIVRLDDTRAAANLVVEGKTDANGRMAVRLPDGYHVLEAALEYWAKDAGRLTMGYTSMSPLRGIRVPAAQPAVTFRARVSGLRPGASGNEWTDYFGGNVHLKLWGSWPSCVTRDWRVQLWFFPATPLADGTHATSFVRDLTMGEIADDHSGGAAGTDNVYNIPVGEYTMTALLLAPQSGVSTCNGKLFRLSVLDGAFQDEGGHVSFRNATPGTTPLATEAVAP